MTTNFIVDLTHFFKNYVPSEYKNAAYLFNNSIVNITDDFYVMAVRCHVPTSYKLIKHSDIPVMWGNVSGIGDGWTSVDAYTLVFVVRFPGNDFTQLPVYHSHTNIIPKYPTHSYEDPRLYKKSDGNIYLYAVTLDKPCANSQGAKNLTCAYTTEWMISYDGTTLNVGDYNSRQIPCEKGILDKLDFNERGELFTKNWSPWSYDGKNYWTDFYPSYTIHEEESPTNSNTCIISSHQPDPFSELKILKEWYTFTFNNNPQTLRLFAFSSTTPSIPISDDIKKAFFSGKNDVYAGVSHVRSNAKTLFQSRDYFEAIIDAMKTEIGLYGSYINFLIKLKSWNDANLIYWHGDIYMMCIYFFVPSVENGQRGNIIATSSVFLPMMMNWDGSLASRYALTFPTGLLFIGTDIIITYGEGDCKSRLMKCPLSELNLTKVDSNYPKNLKFKTLELIGNIEEQRTVDLLKNTIV